MFRSKFFPAESCTVYNRPDCVKHIFTWQIVSWRDFCLSGRLRAALLFHNPCTFKPQLYPCKCMNAIVNTGMVRLVAPCHSTVGGIDDCICISQRVLTDNLRSMEEDGIITRTVYPEVPVRVEYALSELGNTMRPIINSMFEWGIMYQRLVKG